jgi:hypothetical protein
MLKQILEYFIPSTKKLIGVNADGILQMKAFLNFGDSHLTLMVDKFATHLKLCFMPKELILLLLFALSGLMSLFAKPELCHLLHSKWLIKICMLDLPLKLLLVLFQVTFGGLVLVLEQDQLLVLTSLYLLFLTSVLYYSMMKQEKSF